MRDRNECEARMREIEAARLKVDAALDELVGRLQRLLPPGTRVSFLHLTNEGNEVRMMGTVEKTMPDGSVCVTGLAEDGDFTIMFPACSEFKQLRIEALPGKGGNG